VWEPRPSVAIFGMYLRGGRQKNPRAGGSTRDESTRPYGRKRAQSELYRYVPRNAVAPQTAQALGGPPWRSPGSTRVYPAAQPPQVDERGGVRFLVDRKTLDRLRSLRGPGESYSDVILRLAAGGEAR
jgi:hypothetical protein